MRSRISVEIDNKLKGVYVFFTSCEVLNGEGIEIEEEIYRRYLIDPEKLKEDPVVKSYRSFLWRFGIDPTKVRPSGEALRRRIARGDKLPKINCVVDCGNLASLETLVPIGIYDLNKISDPLLLTLSNGGEEFEPIGGKKEFLQKGIPVLISGGKVIHIYPHRDSRITMVTKETREVLVIAAGVEGVKEDIVKEAIIKTCKCLNEKCSGNCEDIMYLKNK
jgi:DNA/RNA-binding domain of Phe-tRNA-synthetase-like protein